MGQRLNIIIVAEGAIDSNGTAITPDLVKNVSAHFRCKKCTRVMTSFL